MSTVREVMAAEYGDDWQKSAISHTFDVHTESYRSDYKDLLIISNTCENDYHGSADAIEVSNYRVLATNWGHLEGLTRGPWSNCDVIALELDSEAPSDLVETLEALAEYPIVSEDEWSLVEQEMIQEHWDSYGKADVLSAVRDAIDADELTDAAEAIVSQLVWEGILDYGCGGGYPSMIDVSAWDFGDKEIAAWFAEHKGTVVTFKPYNGYPESVTFDLTDANIIAQ